MSAPINTFGIVQNTFSVVGGNIDTSTSRFIGTINGGTAFALNNSLVPVGTFLDRLNGANFGATGVQDSTSSTLTYSSPATAVPFEFNPALGLVLVGGGLAWRKLGQKKA